MDDTLNAALDVAVLASLKALDARTATTSIAAVVAVSLGECERRLAALDDAITASDAEEATRLAHALNGVTAMFGAARLPSFCAELEEHSVGNDLAAARATFSLVATEFATFRAALCQEFELA